MLFFDDEYDFGNSEFAALELKEQGNKLLLDHKYALAAEKYAEAIDLYPTAILFSNRAQALIKIELYGLAIQDANNAIRIDPTYVKAYYRRGSANYALGKLKEALKDFQAVVRIAKNDTNALKKMKQCAKELRAEAFNSAIISSSSGSIEPTWSHAKIDSILVERSYHGPMLLESPLDEKGDTIQGPVTMSFVHEMISYLRATKRLHRKVVSKILLLAAEHFQTQPSLLRLTLPQPTPPCSENTPLDCEKDVTVTDNVSDEGHFTICGDTHGQFYDLLHIFEVGGFPSKENPYLFNGDFVDRGSFSFENIITLLAIKLACPDGLYMLRGNHETKNMNKLYGFEGEVTFKYDAAVMNQFSTVFNWLPIAAVISNNDCASPLSVFVVHGGLTTHAPPDGVGVGALCLSEIETITRGREPPESGYVADLLWSDPHILPGRSFSKRGLGFSFGPDYTAAFLEKNKLEYLIRSHEVRDEGYSIEHDGKCITIFSAPNYCDQLGNKGAFVRFGKEMIPQFTKFECSPHPNIPPMRYAGNLFGL